MGILFIVIVIAPAVFLGVARYAGASSGTLGRLSAISSMVAVFGAAVALAITVSTSGGAAESFPIFGASPVVVGIYLDRLSAVMLCLITIIGAVVLRYSVRYLDGDTRHGQFMWLLAATISAVQLLVVANNLVMFFTAWLIVSLSLHSLLQFYPKRPAALACARKKFVISRIGDIALILGTLLTYWSFGTVDFATLFRLLSSTPALTGSVEGQLIAALFALGALTKSAQLPFHSWLPDSLETPTPVSALMHAGVINAGGFLLIRLSPLFQQASIASALLSIVGALTALYGMSVMVTQASIKRRLAYSTVGQMGFMIMQCGLGLYHLALLHIVAHAFYKAYAFLRAGSAMDQARHQVFFPKNSDLSVMPAAVIVVALLVGLVYLGPVAIGQSGTKVAYVPILVVWMLATLQLLLGAASMKERKLEALAVAAGMAGAMASLYLVLSTLFLWYIGRTVAGHTDIGWATALTLVVIFCAGFLLHISMHAFGQTAKGRTFFIHLHNGFYLGVLFDNFTTRVWSVAKLTRI